VRNPNHARLKTRPFQFLLCLALPLLLSVSAGCQSGLWDKITGRSQQKQQVLSQQEIQKLSQQVEGIDLAMLKKAGLHVQCVSRLPMPRATHIKTIFYHNGHLYALNNNNLLTALDGEKGITDWTTTLADPKYPAKPPAFYNNQIQMILGNTYIEIREKDGAILKKFNLNAEAVTGPARSEERIFFGSSDRKLYALRYSDGVPLWHNVCPDDPTGTISVVEDRVFFVSRDNSLFVSTVQERSLLWKFRAAGPLCGVAVDGNQCFLPSADTAMYCFAADTGLPLWKYLAGGSLVEKPVLTPKACYQPIQYQSLICLNRADGSLRWTLEKGKTFLAENGDQTYALTLENEFAVMNNRTGVKTVSFYTPKTELFAPNPETAACYLATRGGTVIALKPDSIAAPAPAPTPAAPAEPSETPPAETAAPAQQAETPASPAK